MAGEMKVKVLLVQVCLALSLGRVSGIPMALSSGIFKGGIVDDTEVIEIPSNSIDIAEEPGSDRIDLSALGPNIFGVPDTEVTAGLVGNYSLEQPVNPEELGTYFEGDILVPTASVLTKNGVILESSRWPGGIVPYEISNQFSASARDLLNRVFDEYHRRTCIRFVPRTTQTDYISIVSENSGCWSSVGRVGGRQEVNLQSPGCLIKAGTALHELMHALGFLHEQNRMERDSYVAIQTHNIQTNARSNFDKAARTEAFGVPYDYGSVMHYSANAFSTNGQPTIVALQPGGNSLMGQRDGFSDMDVEKLNKMYNCGQTAAPALGGVSGPVNPANAATNNIIGSFIGGLISGLGLGDETKPEPTQ